jgi:kynurenine formamidase
VPLEWCYGRGVRLDLRHAERTAGITHGDVEAALDAAGHELAPRDIVLVWTGTDLKQPGYETRHPGLRRDATEFLVDNGVKLIGIDAWGLDRPFDVMIADAVAGKAQFWESHLIGREKEYCQIERLANLGSLPWPAGFTVSAFPFKLERGSAAWARVVAIVDE